MDTEELQHDDFPYCTVPRIIMCRENPSVGDVAQIKRNVGVNSVSRLARNLNLAHEFAIWKSRPKY